MTGVGPGEHRLVVTRYTDISAPRRLAPGRRSVITVRLTCAPLTAGPETKAVPVLLTQMVEIYLQASGKDLEVEGESVRQLRVEPDRDSESVVFYLTTLRAGATIMRLDFLQAGQMEATVKLPIEVSAELGSEQQAEIETPARGCNKTRHLLKALVQFLVSKGDNWCALVTLLRFVAIGGVYRAKTRSRSLTRCFLG
jgi:hypothetical protein